MIAYSFIGQKVSVARRANHAHVLSGAVRDETKHTIVLETISGTKRLLKNGLILTNMR